MDSDALRALQAPLKERYRSDPDAALVTLSAAAELDDGVACSVRTGRELAQAGLHPAAGGDGSLLCSGDMLLEALVACAGVTLRAVATSLGIPVRSGTVRAEGELDFRGTLGVDRAAPVGFRAIRLAFELDTDADAEQLHTLQRLTERYCVVLQTLAQGPELSVSLAAPAGEAAPARTAGQSDPEGTPALQGNIVPLQRAADPTDPGVRVGHVHLRTADIDRIRAFYVDLLGFDVVSEARDVPGWGTTGDILFVSAGGYHHHLGFNTWKSAGGPPQPDGVAGLHHVALAYPTRRAFADAYRRLKAADWPIRQTADHGTHEAIYLTDPDGNDVELMWDRPPAAWPRDEAGHLVGQFGPELDLEELLTELAEPPVSAGSRPT